MRTFVSVLTAAACVSTAAPALAIQSGATIHAAPAHARNVQVAADTTGKKEKEKGTKTGPAGRLNPNVRPPLGPKRIAVGTAAKDAGAPVKILTDAEVSALKNSVTVNEATGERLEFNGGMTPKRSLTKDETWNEGDPISFTITCELIRVTTNKKSGDEDRKPVSSVVRFYVVDKDGGVVISNSLPSEKLMPKASMSDEKAKAKSKAQTEFGFKSEVPKKGNYSIVMVTEFAGKTLGFKETLSFGAPQPPKK